MLARIKGALPLYGVAFLILIIAWWLGNLVRRRLPLRRLNDAPLTQEFVREALRWLIVLLGIFTALETAGVTSLVTALMGGAGILGVGLGFAFQDIIENYLAGILLGMRQPFRKNDLVRIGEFEGKVIRLSNRETVLMTLSGNHLTIPNATVFKGVLYNFTKNPLRRFDFLMGVATNQSFAKVMEIGVQVLNGTPGVVATPKPTALIHQVGSYTLDVNFTGWFDQTTHDFFAVRSEAIRRVNRALMQAGVDLPEPMVRGTKAPEHSALYESEPEEAAVDVTADTDLDKQIEADREATDDKGL
jgi:small conductance mechanosensitive channel